MKILKLMKHFKEDFYEPYESEDIFKIQEVTGETSIDPIIVSIDVFIQQANKMGFRVQVYR